MKSSVPEPLPAFEPVSLRAFLKPGLPPTPRDTLTKTMQTNLKNYENLVCQKKKEGTIQRGTLAVFELDRGFGRTYNPSMTLNMSPCLKTQLRYLFVVSTDDVDLADHQREFSRWILPFERLALQGVAPDVALTMRAGDILHATGNAYPVNLIGACAAPVLKAIEINFGNLTSWPRTAPLNEQDLPDVPSFFLDQIPAKAEKSDRKDSKRKVLKKPGGKIMSKVLKKPGGKIKSTVLKKPAGKNTKKAVSKKPKASNMKKKTEKPSSGKPKKQSPGKRDTQKLSLNFGLTLTKSSKCKRGSAISSDSD